MAQAPQFTLADVDLLTHAAARTLHCYRQHVLGSHSATDAMSEQLRELAERLRLSLLAGGLIDDAVTSADPPGVST